MIAIVDYGLGNIRAFANVYKKANMPYCIASGARDLQKATSIILPGVGAFDQGMKMLCRSGMRETLDDLVLHRKIPVLGICVGMQMLANSSEEGTESGLGWIGAEVKKIDTSALRHKPTLPHMGWNTVRHVEDNALFSGIGSGARFYFLHSYYFRCRDPKQCCAVTDYGGELPCAVHSGNVYGVQFHPEKSHHNGIRLLQNFGIARYA